MKDPPLPNQNLMSSSSAVSSNNPNLNFKKIHPGPCLNFSDKGLVNTVGGAARAQASALQSVA